MTNYDHLHHMPLGDALNIIGEEMSKVGANKAELFRVMDSLLADAENPTTEISVGLAFDAHEDEELEGALSAAVTARGNYE